MDLGGGPDSTVVCIDTSFTVAAGTLLELSDGWWYVTSSLYLGVNEYGRDRFRHLLERAPRYKQVWWRFTAWVWRLFERD